MKPCHHIAIAGLKTSLMIFGAGLILLSAAEAVNWGCCAWQARKL